MEFLRAMTRRKGESEKRFLEKNVLVEGERESYRESLEDPFGHGGFISGFGNDPLRVGPILLEALQNELAVLDALESPRVHFPARSEQRHFQEYRHHQQADQRRKDLPPNVFPRPETLHRPGHPKS